MACKRCSAFIGCINDAHQLATKVIKDVDIYYDIDFEYVNGTYGDEFEFRFKLADDPVNIPGNCVYRKETYGSMDQCISLKRTVADTGEYVYGIEHWIRAKGAPHALKTATVQSVPNFDLSAMNQMVRGRPSPAADSQDQEQCMSGSVYAEADLEKAGLPIVVGGSMNVQICPVWNVDADLHAEGYANTWEGSVTDYDREVAYVYPITLPNPTNFNPLTTELGWYFYGGFTVQSGLW